MLKAQLSEKQIEFRQNKFEQEEDLEKLCQLNAQIES